MHFTGRCKHDQVKTHIGVKLAIITHVVHGKSDQSYFAYGPYVREMNLWNQYAGEVIIVAPLTDTAPDPIHLPYTHQRIGFKSVPRFNLLTASGILRSALLMPVIFWRVFHTMRQADHIHLRCPGNMGLIGCIVQILFPRKPKTAKYAGNWDPDAKQPWTYKLQRRILSHTWLTRNMKVLVYGQWPAQSRNIVPFFTATYREQDKLATPPRSLTETLKLVFVGTLSPGKRPVYALELAHQLRLRGHDIRLDFYGEGPERAALEAFIAHHKLENVVQLHGNQHEEMVRSAYRNAHFLLLPSRSEGWPKVVAEAMFWGCLPAATAVSCVSFMLDKGKRGIILHTDLHRDVAQFESLVQNPDAYREKASLALDWSRQYTLEKFESAIQKMLVP